MYLQALVSIRIGREDVSVVATPLPHPSGSFGLSHTHRPNHSADDVVRAVAPSIISQRLSRVAALLLPFRLRAVCSVGRPTVGRSFLRCPSLSIWYFFSFHLLPSFFPSSYNTSFTQLQPLLSVFSFVSIFSSFFLHYYQHTRLDRLIRSILLLPLRTFAILSPISKYIQK